MTDMERLETLRDTLGKLQQELQSLVAARQQVDFQLIELGRTVDELKKIEGGDEAPAVYHSVGSVLVEVKDVPGFREELEDTKSTLEVQKTRLENKEGKAKEQFDLTRQKLDSALRGS